MLRADQAKKQAEEWVALPGTSEHQLGLAVDINADTSACTKAATEIHQRGICLEEFLNAGAA